MRTSIRLATALCSLLLAGSGLGAEARISLVTILPGKALYSSFGHSAIRVVDEDGDRLYNFGLSDEAFDLRFALNMLRGRMNFMVGALRTESILAYYREEENRGIVEQALELDGTRKARLIAILESAASRENRIYNYRYFADNCVTRPASILRELVGDSSPPFAGDPKRTLRSSVNEVLASRPWLRFAIGLLFGPGGDRPIPDGPLFLPKDLMAWAASASFTTAAGRIALVGGTETLYEARPSAAPAFSPSPLLAALFILALALLATWPSVRFGSWLSARFARARLAYDGALFVLALFLGVAILVFWLSAGYAETGWNLNLLWASPLPLLALVAGRAGSRSGAVPSSSIWLFRTAAALACLLALGGGFGLQAIPAELRLLAAAVALRSASRGGLLRPVSLR